ncbi:MAG: PorP/SprF family type IX secretion system membrane protein [Eudoraea sp.]|nr:PorP/SprF family type IX secretion system membrane protein [Eudoraea sp.]NNK30004.1 PorP/SprF family type IX secretion system membrane protein [Flavobacteriaceae bacterium]
MRNSFFFITLLTGIVQSIAQAPSLPVDLRQHNLTEFNSSLLSPVFSLDRNQPRSVALWSRWQWQTIDGDPTTILLNYTQKFTPEMAGGLGVFQHNTGVFLNRGGVLNYAYALELSPGIQLAAGLNLFGYQRQLADDRFQINPDIVFPQFGESNDFIVQLAPSFRFQFGQFSLGMVVENLIDYNLSANESQVSANGNIFMGLAGYRIPVNLFADSGSSFLQPTLYVKRLPDFENQVGITTLFSTPRFWAQAGFNSFYGVSGGIGGRFFNKFSIGALIEYGTQSDLRDQDPSFELVTAYTFGPQTMRKKISGFEEKDEQEVLVDAIPVPEEKDIPDTEQVESEALKEAAALAAAKKVRDSLAKIEETKGILKEQLKRRKQRDSIRDVEKRKAEMLAAQKKQRRLDSVAAVRWEQAQKDRAQRVQDSLREREAELAEAARRKVETLKTAQKREKVTPMEGEKYEEAVSEEGLEPGYYLIANVFGTKRYYEAFMKTLRDKGLNPKSFYRASRKFNYVYLGRYNTIREARQARDSKFNGRYTDKTWIFRVVEK